MKITLCSSAIFAHECLAVKRNLEDLGHQVFMYPREVKVNGEIVNVTTFWKMRKSNLTTELLKIKSWLITDHFNKIAQSDAILVLNFNKNNITGYVGGNTFLEMGVAYYLGKKIFVWQQPSQMLSYYEEIAGMNHTDIDGNLRRVSDKVRVTVGSKNPAKVDAVAEVLANYDLFKNATIDSHEVDSQISDQPVSLEETIRGAMNRARNAFVKCGYSFGIESGLVPAPYTKSGYFDTCICAIFDGQQFHLGGSTLFEYPPKMLPLVFNHGLNISQAAKHMGLTDHDYIGHDRGMIGILTSDRVTRKEYTKQAITTAMIHLENPELY
jgi:inosine/xanthosine triphosphatase